MSLCIHSQRTETGSLLSAYDMGNEAVLLNLPLDSVSCEGTSKLVESSESGSLLQIINNFLRTNLELQCVSLANSAGNTLRVTTHETLDGLPGGAFVHSLDLSEGALRLGCHAIHLKVRLSDMRSLGPDINLIRFSGGVCCEM